MPSLDNDPEWVAAGQSGFSRYASWHEYSESVPWTLRPGRIEHEAELASRFFPDTFRIHCSFCRAEVEATVAWGEGADSEPNWRESTACPDCGLISRVRFSIELMTALLGDRLKPQIYMTEQATVGHLRVFQRFRSVIGSEFVDQDKAKHDRLQTYLKDLMGNPKVKLRNEDVTRLSLADASVDAVLSMEVLEHVPDFRRALTEFHRVLRKGGIAVISVPFIENAPDSLLRARVTEDGIQHLLPPEYHGDPTQDDGCLAFHTFGWDLLDAIRESGFSEVFLVDNWNPGKGYLGFVGCIYARK